MITDVAPRPPGGRLAWPAAVLLLAGGGLAALTETRFPGIMGIIMPRLNAADLALGLLCLGVALVSADQFPRLPWRRPSVAIALAFLFCLAAGKLGGVSWPNSGDEYSYVYFADTLRLGRLWNPAPADLELFRAYHVLVRDGRAFSQYPPGWPALLLPFRALGAEWLANPLLTALTGLALAGACCRLGLSPAVRRPALALVLLTPFTCFLGGSLFAQTMAAALVAGTVWAQLADEAAPRRWRKLLVGALFGLLLLTRLEVFALLALAYAVDRLALRRSASIADALPVMAGALPFAVCFAAANAGITGDPLQLPTSWASVGVFDAPVEGIGSGPFMHAVSRNLYWTGSLAQFGGLAAAALAGVALVAKIRRRTCRFYDALFPLAVVFYIFVPFTGGHRYGPRYWFWAWPLCALTIATGLVDAAGWFRIAGRRVWFEGFVAASLLYGAAAFCGLLVTTHAYIDARRAVYEVPLSPGRAVLLVPGRALRIWPWQAGVIGALSADFTRNPVGTDAPVLYGRADVPDAVRRACRFDGREVFLWEPPGRLARMHCP